MTKHIILFLAASPSSTDPRALGREARSIHSALKRSGHRDRFVFETRWAAQPLDLLRELRELKPTVVHFSGHGGQDGLLFQAANGDAQLVSPAAIEETFGSAGRSVKLVVLSACYSEASAEALLEHVECIVGMGGSIHDDAARIFAIGFYGALGEHESVAAAYRQGSAAIRLEGVPDFDRPQLKVRDGGDPTRLVLAAVTQPVRVDLPCPYPGMRPYSAADADHFHGRDAEIEEMLGRLRAGDREIYVIGPSGSGKSSLVAAGLSPRLTRGAAGLAPFVIRSMRPGEHPTERLREVLEAPDDAPRTSVLVVIDQLEELFTQANAEQRTKFLTALRSLRAERACVIVFTLRADFFVDFMESPLWTERRDRISRIEVGPLRGKPLREAIVRPARDLGVLVEPELLERLLADAGAEPGVLPLLQETLVQLWDRPEGPTLTLAGYQALGDGSRSGLAIALSRRADATLRALDRAQEPIARRILLRLISFGEGRSDTRRQQPRSKLRAADDEARDFDAVLRRLIADRLLATNDDGNGGEPCIELAHEVMITAWPTLAAWLGARRADEQRRRQLEGAASQWVERGRGAGGLLDPIELAEAEAWRRTEAARELGPSADVAALMTASRAAQMKAEAHRRRLRWLAAGAGTGMILLLAVIAATAISVARTQEQELQRDALRTNAYAAHALAGAVAFHLREQIDAVVAIGADPAVVRLLHDVDHEALAQRRRETPFESFTLLDRSGTVISNVSATGSRNIGKGYAWRDYFHGARRLGETGDRAGYISRVIQSEDDGLHKFGITTPVYDNGTWGGVLMATIGTDFALSRKRLDRASEAGPMAVVVAPRDRSRYTTEGAGEYVVVLHEGLAHGAGVVIDSPRLRELRRTRADRKQLRWIDPEPITDDAHRDPVRGYDGRWLAGFAPVGDTGFVVIVQTRYDAAVGPNARLSRRFVSRMGIVILVWVGMSGTGLWFLAWRAQRHQDRIASTV